MNYGMGNFAMRLKSESRDREMYYGMGNFAMRLKSESRDREIYYGMGNFAMRLKSESRDREIYYGMGKSHRKINTQIQLTMFDVLDFTELQRYFVLLAKIFCPFKSRTTSDAGNNNPVVRVFVCHGLLPN